MNIGWEDLNNIECTRWKFQKSDRVRSDFHSFKISRDNKLALKIEITYKPTALQTSNISYFHEPKRKAGEVYTIDGYLHLTNIYAPSKTLELLGISLISSNIRTYHDETTATITCAILSINEVNNSKDDIEESNFTLDWITNLDISNYMWSSGVKETKESTITRIFSSQKKSISFMQSSESISNNSNNCCIRVQDVDIFFGTTDCSEIDKKYNPGFILYSKNCDNEFRKKVRNALSFILGCKIIHIASSLKDKHYNSIEFEIHTQSTINELYHTSYNHPPSPLYPSGASYAYLGEDEISLMTEKIISEYDKYDFNHFSWIYWHAIASPLHLKGVGFGATLEFIQRKYIEQNPSSFDTKLISKQQWKILHQSLLSVVNSDKSLDEESKRLLLSKISGLNQTPQSILTTRFYETLNLPLGSLEKNSFRQRNNSAHGNKQEEDNVIPDIREIKLLRIVCNRIILRIYDLSDCYHDFYSLGGALRNLEDPIPEIDV